MQHILKVNQIIKIQSKFKARNPNQTIGFYNRMKIFISDSEEKKYYYVKITKVLQNCAFAVPIEKND